MCKVDRDEKKFCRSDTPYPEICPQSWARQNLKSVFHHEAVIFLQF